MPSALGTGRSMTVRNPGPGTAAARWVPRRPRGITALAMLAALGAAGCVAGAGDPAEPTEIVSVARTGGGAFEVFACYFPLCGGVELRFDSRDLGLSQCAYDEQAGSLDCVVRPAHSPAMPAGFWDLDRAELFCEGELQFRCETSRGVTTCVCDEPVPNAPPPLTIKTKKHSPQTGTT
jgi:hypothetical protein